MTKLSCEYLFERSVWLFVIIMSRASVSVNLHSIYCLNVKKLLTWSRCNARSLSDSIRIWSHKHFLCEPTLNHLAQEAKWLSCDVSTYLYGAFYLYCIAFYSHPEPLSS